MFNFLRLIRVKILFFPVVLWHVKQHILDILLASLWIEMVGLNDMWQLTIHIELVVLIYHLLLELGDSNVILAHIYKAPLI